MDRTSTAYLPSALEPHWQQRWSAAQAFRARNPGEPGFDPAQRKHYVLDMFPYPSGSGLHVGHAVGYVATDAVARRRRALGENVLHPMGWDAFGLPAEQYAIQTGQHPSVTTAHNTANFRRQLQRIGLSYDWERELDTSNPRYYRWTQWIFARLYERGLAYQTEVPVWWCEELKTVLANEEVINGRSERGNHPCVRRPLRQWMLRITAYADRLLADLDGLDWPESVKSMQREWIGRSEGAQIRFELPEHAGAEVEVFTTRPDTLFGATFLVLAPEHALVQRISSDAQRAAVEAYVRASAAKSELERAELSKVKTGVFTGAYAHNPAFESGDARARIPIWVADYVLAGYGTGAIMAVPGQDQRDWDFARAHGLAIVRTVQPPADWKGEAFSGDGPAIASGFLDGLQPAAAKRAMIAWLEQRKRGSARVTYRLRDWLFSRQRYWGEPFPLLHREDGRIELVPDAELPVELPPMADFSPAADGSAPLARAREWVQVPARGEHSAARRETDTMPGWAGSCWYYLRFMDPHNHDAPFARAAEQYWGPVDLYVGGAAHAVLHLLYARFWHKVLYDLGLVHTAEPFQRLFNQGMITAYAYQDAQQRLVPSDEVEEGPQGCTRKGSGEPLERIVTKMAKSLKNVVNPDEIIAEHGADTLRLYELFMGPLADSKPWNPRDIPGCRRFLERVWKLVVEPEGDGRARASLMVAAEGAPQGTSLALERALHRALKRIDDSFADFNLNTAVAALMSWLNEAARDVQALRRDQVERMLIALAPFAPHIAEELWQRLGHTDLIAHARWPEVDARMLEDEQLELPIQVNGKLRGKLSAPRTSTPQQIEQGAREAVAAQLEGKEVLKLVHVPGKLLNFVVR
jgi:leucyl-tRNA synthetase